MSLLTTGIIRQKPYWEKHWKRCLVTNIISLSKRTLRQRWSEHLELLRQACHRKHVWKHGKTAHRLYRLDKCTRCGIFGYELGGEWNTAGTRRTEERRSSETCRHHRLTAGKPKIGYRPLWTGNYRKCIEFLPLLPERWEVEWLLGLFRIKKYRYYQCVSAFNGASFTVGCPGLVSSSQSIGRGLSKVSATLFIQELSDRKAGYLVCCPQSTYCYYPVQLSQSGKRIEKYSLCRKAHWLGSGKRGTGNHRWPDVCKLG